MSEYYILGDSEKAVFEKSINSLIREIYARQGKQKPKRIVFTEALDERVLKASRYLYDQRLASPILVGAPSQIRDFAEQRGLRTQGIKIRYPLHDPYFDSFVKELQHLQRDKDLTRSDAQELLRDPQYYGAMLLRNKAADICLAGNQTNPSKVIRTAIKVIGLQPGSQIVSSFLLMISADMENMFAFADGYVIPRPDSNQLAEIALRTAHNYRTITGQEPRVAMLSFSTNKSADHDLAQKVRDAVQIARERKPALILDGEVQFDAAIVPEIAQKKAPNCRLQGRANVFIFPSLNAANIGYQITQTLAGYTVLGSFLQGLNGHMHGLLPESTSDDIINFALIASCM